MDELLIRLRQVLDSANTLYHESQVLTLQGDFHGSLRKKRAGDFAMQEHYKLNAAYKRLWMYYRRKNRASIPYPSSLCTGRDVIGTLVSLFTFSYYFIMSQSTISAPALKHIFQNKPQQSAPSKSVPQKQEFIAPVPSKKKEVKTKKFWGYLSKKGRVYVMRYVSESDAPEDQAKLTTTEILEPKDYTRMTTKSFKKWQDDAYDIVNAATEEFEAKSFMDARVTAEKLLAKAVASYRAEKAKKAAKPETK